MQNSMISSKSGAVPLDRMDYRIIKALVEDGRISDTALGERLHLSSTAVARRRRQLEEAGVIKSYTAFMNAQVLGLSMTVIVHIELTSQAEQVLMDFEEAVLGCPSMSFCSFVSGETDFIMMVHVPTFEAYDAVYRKELSTLPHVARIRSSFVMRQVAARLVPPAAFDRLD
ncbi:AsnC family transcriptional regulator [Novosphingobium sp. 9U]|nr:AsnC family transcriptional regulator [Novosphingobium sp. 9U]